MKTILILSVVAVTGLLLAGTYYTEDNSQFQAYIAQYAKSYTSEAEYNFRKSLFESNLAKINLINSEEHSYTLGMNKFGDWTDEEFSQLLGFKASTEYVQPANLGEKRPKADKSIDWTAQGVVSDVKNQGKCGSCWAFSAVGAIEGAFAIRCDSGVITEFSEQQLVDCETEDNGCNGGEMYHAFAFYQDRAPCFEKNYPYTAVDGDCKDEECSHDSQRISSFTLITDNDPEDLHDNLIYGPHSLGVEADKDVFRFFKEGVIDDDSCGNDLNHGVLLTGYIASKDAWKVKNSWGADWGEEGYVYIKDNHTVSKGFCGVNMEISRPNL